MHPKYEVADVLKVHWQAIEQDARINTWQLRTLGAIMRCRTSALGGNKAVCTACGTIRISYNSCRNRHCPKCQGKQREQWIEARNNELLPVPYFHVVFTLPDTINSLAMHQPKIVYDTLFDAAWATIRTFAQDKKHLGAKPGMISILHTWGQTMTLHPHIHCIVPGGGLDKEGKWKTARNKGKYLFPVLAMSKVFRAKYVEMLKERVPNLDKTFINELFRHQWVVYAKRPFSHPSFVVEYLGRYTHKIAISNHRIQSIENGEVSFNYKDYRQQGIQKVMSLTGLEFIRRFSLHILPKGFVRIRHYGILSSTSKPVSIPAICNQLPIIEVKQAKEVRNQDTYNPLCCPDCKTETMRVIEIIPTRGPPQIKQPSEKYVLHVS